MCDHSMKAIEQTTFMWYCLLCCTRWFKLLRLRIKLLCVTIQMKAIEQYFYVVRLNMLYKVVQDFTSDNKTLMCDHSNESY